MASTRVRIARSSLLVLASLGAIWHALPLLVWYLHLEPELERAPHARRLDVPIQSELPEAPSSFGRIAYHGVSLRAPLADPGSADPADPGARGCGDGSGVCYRALEGGSVSLHAEGPSESYWEMVALRAPDRDDISVLRSASANWETIQALRIRTTTRRSALDSWRYDGLYTRGVVADVVRNGHPSYVVATYSRRGPGARVIGVAGVSKPVLMQMLGTIRFSD